MKLDLATRSCIYIYWVGIGYSRSADLINDIASGLDP